MWRPEAQRLPPRDWPTNDPLGMDSNCATPSLTKELIRYQTDIKAWGCIGEKVYHCFGSYMRAFCRDNGRKIRGNVVSLFAILPLMAVTAHFSDAQACPGAEIDHCSYAIGGQIVVLQLKKGG